MRDKESEVYKCHPEQEDQKQKTLKGFDFPFALTITLQAGLMNIVPRIIVKGLRQSERVLKYFWKNKKEHCAQSANQTQCLFQQNTKDTP